MIAFLPVLCIIAGLITGLIRYVKYGDNIRKRVEKEFADERAKGGIHSLYHKRPDKRVVYETFGFPLFVGFLIGLFIMFIVFIML